MQRLLLVLVFALPLSGCGVFLPYFYDAGILDDRLTLPMSKTEVLRHLGKPDRIVEAGAQQTVWEYRLYAKHEWLGYLVHCPWHPYCYFPAEPPTPYYVALQNDQLCLWGSPDVVRTLAWKVCGHLPPGERYVAGEAGVRLSVIPVFMPPPLSPLPRRLAVLSTRGVGDDRVASWLDLTLNFLRSRHPELVFAEREDLRAVSDEVEFQHLGRADDNTTVRVGQLTGADSLLLSRLSLTGDAGPPTASFDLRVIRIESGTTLFRQLTTVALAPPGPERAGVSPNESAHLAGELATEEAVAYGLAALAAAFGDNPLGIVPDHAWPGKGVKLLGLLQGSPAILSGLQPGDRILTANGRPFRYWTDRLSLPSVLTIERDGATMEIGITASPEFGRPRTDG